MQITNHTQLLNALIAKYNLKSYLEIGVQNPANNFDKIKAEFKVGVDPEIEQTPTNSFYRMGSDEFFVLNNERDKYHAGDCFDLIFIDGLHHADQVKCDFENSLRCLSDNGFIVIHDVLPENEVGTKVPRETKQWWGDVYMFAMSLFSNYQDVSYKTFNIDNGCMLVWKEKRVDAGDISYYVNKHGLGNPFNPWKLYLNEGHTIMNVTSTVEI